MGARAVAAAVISFAAAAVLVVEGLSWSHSARFGPPAATTFRCTVRLDSLSGRDISAGLQTGDFLDLPRMDVPSRVAEVFHYTPTQAGRAGEVIHLAVTRGSRNLVIPYTLQHTDPVITFLAQLAFKLVLLVLAVIVLWRGTDKASLLLGVWCTSVGLGLPDAWWGSLPVAGRITGGALTAFLWTCSPFILYLVVESIATGVSRLAKFVTRACMAVLILPAIVINAVDATAQALSGCSVLALSPWMTNAAFASSQLVIIAFFVLSYARTTGLAKQRIRWVFWAFMLSRAGVLLNLINRLLIHPVQLSGFEWATVLIFPLGCAYAILRHHLIDVNFVLNRTLVFTILTSLIVGIFILLEDLLKTFAAGHGVGVAVETAVALAIGFSFNAMHKYLVGAIERAIFRAKYEAMRVLQTLAEEAPFMESADALLARTVKEVCEAAGACDACIYERVDDTYKLSARSGAMNPQNTLPIDDLAFVRMRKTHAPIDLNDISTMLGNDGIAFPFLVRGVLTGALVCRKRGNGEAYAPDEIALLSSVAHEVGAELHAIRARQQSELLDALLAGNLDVGQARAQLGTT